ncbi:Agamous-like MADS-box protein mads9 [Turnera subulata]|uniref:Agamous-like MADS-box protein mads9 n=1 Tax=Turnera subulata TaxID=218843 RepID=A0A9Q0GFQ9_9ROSI|nr:Agamous-like MADS-box protein mads9 [Turnera subulata]
MGRGKIEIKRIENSSNRQVTYSKRRNGMIKKAKEISILCDAKVSLLMFASSGKMHEYCSPSTSLEEMLESYQKQSAGNNRLWDAKHESLNDEINRMKKENDTLQVELRHLKGEEIASLHHSELISIADALENGLASVREKQWDYYRMIERNTQVLEEEGKRLSFILQQQQENMAVEEEEAREMDNAYGQEKLSEYNSSIPFPFVLQPTHQPNLEKRM